MSSVLIRVVGVLLMLTALALSLSRAPDRPVESLVARWAPPPSDFVEVKGAILPQHYAFLISEEEFDAIFGRIRERGLSYWADPFHHEPGQINRRDGGRGVYFDDPSGHNLEILTRPYGSGADHS